MVSEDDSGKGGLRPSKFVVAPLCHEGGETKSRPFLPLDRAH